MRIAFFIGILMMLAVGGDPENRSAFQRQSGANGQKVFNPLGSFVAAMREQPVIAHSDSQASGNPPENYGRQYSLPTEEEKCSDRANMKCNHEKGGNPIYRLRKCLVSFYGTFHVPVPFISGPVLLPVSA